MEKNKKIKNIIKNIIMFLITILLIGLVEYMFLYVLLVGNYNFF